MGVRCVDWIGEENWLWMVIQDGLCEAAEAHAARHLLLSRDPRSAMCGHKTRHLKCVTLLSNSLLVRAQVVAVQGCILTSPGSG